MSNFNGLFDQWANHYDATVYGNNHEYVEVFENYHGIFESIRRAIEDKKEGTILEIGVGTGNLTKYLYEQGYHMIGIEPSIEMRKIAGKKLPLVKILDGHFLFIPITEKVDGIVTSYAFHHLTLEEKRIAAKYLDNFLKPGGKVVIADTMFESSKYKEELYHYVKSVGAENLLQDLNTEFYEYIDDLCSIFREMGYTYQLEKMNKYVWTLAAKKESI